MLINKELFKKYGLVPSNYNLDELMLYVPIAEQIWIKPAIGELLYDDIQREVDSGVVSDKYSALLTDGGLYMYLTTATLLQALPFVWTRISEIGIVKGKSDNSESVSLKDMTYIEGNLRKTVDTLKLQLIKWLCERCDHFPLFDESQCTCGCSCGCGGNTKALKRPNRNFELYTTMRCDTDIV